MTGARMLARLTSLLAVAVGLTVASTSACAGLSHRVDRDLLEDVPNEELLMLFDAENAVYIARDEAELARRNLEDARKARERARKYKDLIADRRNSGAAIDSSQVLQLLEEWNDARIDMREKEAVLREEELATSDVRLWAARARYERAKAKLIKDFNPGGGADIDMTDFDEQVTDWEGKEKEALEGLTTLEEALSTARTTYIDLAVRLQKESKGAYGGPWADLLD